MSSVLKLIILFSLLIHRLVSSVIRWLNHIGEVIVHSMLLIRMNSSSYDHIGMMISHSQFSIVKVARELLLAQIRHLIVSVQIWFWCLINMLDSLKTILWVETSVQIFMYHAFAEPYSWSIYLIQHQNHQKIFSQTFRVVVVRKYYSARTKWFLRHLPGNQYCVYKRISLVKHADPSREIYGSQLYLLLPKSPADEENFSVMLREARTLSKYFRYHCEPSDTMRWL
jgi:hypothetical protein